MNGKQAKQLRRISMDERHYKKLKREFRTITLRESQHPKLVETRKRKPSMGTASGVMQGPRNPLIVIRPVRALVNKLIATNRKSDGTVAPLSKMQGALLRSTKGAPKHWLDHLAV